MEYRPLLRYFLSAFFNAERIMPTQKFRSHYATRFILTFNSSVLIQNRNQNSYFWKFTKRLKKVLNNKNLSQKKAYSLLPKNGKPSGLASQHIRVSFTFKVTRTLHQNKPTQGKIKLNSENKCSWICVPRNNCEHLYLFGSRENHNCAKVPGLLKVPGFRSLNTYIF